MASRFIQDQMSHIRWDDVLKLAEWMAPWRPRFELNVEGFPDDRLMEIVRIVRPEQCTLVPDDPNVLTSEEGWKLDNHDSQIAASAVPAFQREGCRVILFIDPDPSVIPSVVQTGADGIEIYTGSYAGEFEHCSGGACGARLGDSGQPRPRFES
jgi:pyridoxine 5-phosphate synthase